MHCRCPIVLPVEESITHPGGVVLRLMRYFLLACDYDSTIAENGKVAPSTAAALQRLGASGRKVVLVTGRELEDLCNVFPEYTIFDRIVAENGALLFTPATRESKVLTEPPTPEFVAALRAVGVRPLEVGRTIVSTDRSQDAAVLSVIRELGLEMQVIYNRDAVMILPSGVNKATGLRAAATDLGLSLHNAVGVGDAENDHALLSVCECRVAVANAIPMLKDRADLVTSDPDGKGVEQLIDKLLLDDLRSIEPRSPRYPIILGTGPDGKDVTINPYGSSIVVAGPSASGKSTAAMSILEQLLENGYQVCVIDPEGDYGDVEKLIALGSASHAPDLTEVAGALQKPKASVSVNLLGLPMADRPTFFASLLPKILELRARTGRPHWVIVDEAHHVLPSTWDPAVGSVPQKLLNFLLITVHVSAVAHPALKMMDSIIAVGATPEHTILEFSEAIGRPSPVNSALPSNAGEVFAWFVNDRRGLLFLRVRPSTTEMRRHKRKYAEGRLGPDRSFFFRGSDDKMNIRAHNLTMFSQIAEGIDDETWLFHLRQGDYSKWIREGIKDNDLAAEIMQIEKNSAANARDSRSQIIEAINRRYTSPETVGRAG
jgi:HAD superfamily hydrolase (TIGR01484 family)